MTSDFTCRIRKPSTLSPRGPEREHSVRNTPHIINDIVTRQLQVTLRAGLRTIVFAARFARWLPTSTSNGQDNEHRHVAPCSAPSAEQQSTPSRSSVLAGTSRACVASLAHACERDHRSSLRDGRHQRFCVANSLFSICTNCLHKL